MTEAASAVEPVETSQVLYSWPPAAQFGRVVPKKKFYEHGKVPASLREQFVNDVQRIIWTSKLAESTIRLQGTTAVPEIQVFNIETKRGALGDAVLAGIDKAVHFPIIFEVTEGARVRMVAAHKTLGGANPKVGAYFSTDWFPVDAPRMPLPTAIDLPGLYEALLSPLLPVQTRRGESVLEVTARMERRRKLEREVALLERRLRTEPQLNRKIELRRELKDRQAALAEVAAG